MPREGRERPVASVVIPAHNEATVLGRLLDALRSGVEPGQLEVVVACNGCTDDTAAVAREHGATVVEIGAPSKMAALTAADAVATVFPRCYIDADVVVTGGAVMEVVRLLADPDARCAAPQVRFDLTERPWAVRAYHVAYLRDPYLSEEHVGSGFYALSEQGHRELARFPELLQLLTTARYQPPAEDLFVRNLFTRAQRRVGPEPFVIQAPRTLRTLLRRRIRMFRANRELSAHPDFRTLPGTREYGFGHWSRKMLLVPPCQLPDTIVYMTVDIVARIAARWPSRGLRPVEWGRDHTTRTSVSG